MGELGNERARIFEVGLRAETDRGVAKRHLTFVFRLRFSQVKEFKFPGEELFRGPVMHTARFDRSVPLEGKTVAVIGNGSSGIQT